jgi:hypothetical protein
MKRAMGPPLPRLLQTATPLACPRGRIAVGEAAQLLEAAAAAAVVVSAARQSTALPQEL